MLDANDIFTLCMNKCVYIYIHTFTYYTLLYIYNRITGKSGQTSISLCLENAVSFTFIYLYIVISKIIREYYCCMLQSHCEKQIDLYMHLYIA